MTMVPPKRKSQNANCVESGERHIRGADLQRMERVGEAGEQRCREQKQHHGACTVNSWLYCSFVE